MMVDTLYSSNIGSFSNFSHLIHHKRFKIEFLVIEILKKITDTFEQGCQPLLIFVFVNRQVAKPVVKVEEEEIDTAVDALDLDDLEVPGNQSHPI